MDRCRCEDYAEAVKKIKFYTVGTLRPDKLENHDAKDFKVQWVRQTPGYTDFKFTKPKARYVHTGEKDLLSHEDRRIEHMWCPYMTPVKK